MNQPKQTSWDKEFDDRFRYVFNIGTFPDSITKENIKLFIHFALQNQAEEIEEVVEGLKVLEIHTKYCEYNRHGCDCGYVERCSYNKCLADTLLAIKQITTK